ncbi:TerC family protein [Paralimibaculum aggregatum]|uniref:TerC family protein n=1 Tax=Paralimibaculum aggregatum TaxID=3036245 RepID=UPI002557409C|nr:tellurium resistance protein TerC [Limibaculum sp. NKW23]
MDELFTLTSLLNLGVLIFLQAVLGFDNLLYISIESQRAPAADQARVRRTGILIAIGLRIVLLFAMIQLIEALAEPFYVFAIPGIIEGGVNFSTVIFVFGGAFLMYTAVKEINHLLKIEDPEHTEGREPKSATAVIAMIVLMNLIFSFDSILSALAITDLFPLLAIAIIASGVGMLLLADTVSSFIRNNRKYEVLGLFILLIVGVVLLGESGHAAEPHLHLFGYAVEPMSKATFYFSIAVLVAVDILQTGYQKKLARLREREAAEQVAAKAAAGASPAE